ncbi:S-adenosyl-L-methionine-dependent methyltransferase [Cryphonectria parasitica EP155]|uniref:S-adenosyl-L-methionine-dependent methyltransferase n=1 Tax=Cryphonectria parasitica (strain ATCC 38755 / EP155) TaxID=660469 RepID=A0A9P5CL00_CRYP1|nr:S-adenosyl-L-methionine-dependent methyltransferase [Cryphonectria parasitica EP155]KAF3761300.1 S-adenosyl-L-methionine-dependent methyltransferase [Cryphonectria parasitica EP155]
MPPKKPARKAKQATVTDVNASFTQEAFEKELKDLRSKAKEETWARWGQEQATVYLRSLVLIALAAVYANVSELTLSPVYGSIPVSLWHNKLIVASLFVGWACNLHLGRLVPIRLSYVLPIIAFYIPAAQFYLFKVSATLTAYQGPFITELLTVVPLVIFSVACTANYLEGADLSGLPGFIRDAAPGITSYGYYKLVESLSGKFLAQHIGSTVFCTRVVLETVLSTSYALFAPSKYLVLALPALLHTAFFNTHVMTPMAAQSLNSTLTANKWLLVDRKESSTGYISVVDSLENGYRVMRADHSLLGGEWIRFKGKRVAEPIYGVFTMLEAVRLVETPEPIVDTEAEALVIGLGIGTLPAALVAHGVDTTVVEIDPVVYEFAAKYFQLPSNHTAVVADAITYTEELVNKSDSRFDYIVHDVFTGGAEPVPLFTLEFLQNLHTLLKPNGVVAINYAGDFMLPPPKIVVQTIREVFPSCRIYRENPRDDAVIEEEKRDFTNMVIFCTKAEGPVKFRKITAADMLQSRTRELFLPPRYEVTEKDFRASGEVQTLRNNDTAALEKWHEKSALGHWEVMRTVLPDIVWEGW